MNTLSRDHRAGAGGRGVFLVFAFGAADRIFVLIGLSYNTQLYIFRFAIFIVPLVLFLVFRRLWRELQAADRIEEVHEQAKHHERSLERARGPGERMTRPERAA